MPGESRAISAALARLAAFGLLVAVVAGLAQVFAGPGRRLGLWDHSFGFKILEWAAYTGLAAAAIAVLGLLFAWRAQQRRLVWMGLAGAILGGLIGYWPGALQTAFRTPPPLYDISTDAASPPPFVAAIELRKGARLPLEYPPAFAAQQKTAYPDIQPAIVKLAPPQAFERALKAAHDMGWRVHAAVPADGRIEAVAKTFWFGFEDDVVIRVAATEGGSRIDVRSAGRLGRRDGGANAQRVQVYLKKLAATGN